MYDVAIVGAGPAAISAALNLKLHNKNVIWFGSGELSRKVERSERIANYPGAAMVTGPALNRAFREQLEGMDIAPVDRMVTTIARNGDSFMVLGGNEIYEARTVLLCTGAATGKGFAGEEEHLGRGVSYCATCDGFLYKGKSIAVYCQDKRYEHEVAYLAELAERVLLFTPYKDPGVMPVNVETAAAPMKEVLGKAGGPVTAVRLTDGSETAVDGVFILRNAVAPDKLFMGLELDGPHMVVNRQMETNIEGCFAAGDCTGRPYQIAKAVGEGNVAAHSILAYLG